MGRPIQLRGSNHDSGPVLNATHWEGGGGMLAMFDMVYTSRSYGDFVTS